MTTEIHDTVLEELTRVLVDRFAPERIVLFGSRGRGDHRPDSDYDLMIVMNQPPEPRQSVYMAICDVHSSVDVIVDTPDEFDRRTDDVGTLEYVAHREGRVLYAREGAVVARRVREGPPKEPESLKEWRARAESDFTMMTVGMAGAPQARDAIVFHGHQAAEKILKAALIAQLVPPPRTHDLEELVRLLKSELRDDQDLLNACRGLNKLWPSARYPEKPMPTAEQVADAIAWASHVRAAISAILP